MNHLEMATTQELIEEICKRSTFCGMILHSRDENTNSPIHKEFALYTSMGEDTPLILQKILEFYPE